ncbi:MAG: T9SS type A sorting domain-containing protein, partial [Flavobacteriales bacterium]|nr:T9SS type A sorting domain-containing protein [Flavobacteriales bacterium]
VLGQVVEVYQLDNQRELIILRKEKTKGIYFVELKVNNKKIFKKIVLQ